MDVNPMSMQMVVPRAAGASEVQHNLNQQMALQQDYEALKGKNDAELKQKQVRTKDETEDGKIKDEGDRRTPFGAAAIVGGRIAEDDAVSAERYAVDPDRGRFIDFWF
jgi:dihydroxyacid dehydratase/phosphogluconate dehydratase